MQEKTPTKVVSSNQDHGKPKKSKVRRKIPRDVNKISEKRQKTRKKHLIGSVGWEVSVVVGEQRAINHFPWNVMAFHHFSSYEAVVSTTYICSQER